MVPNMFPIGKLGNYVSQGVYAVAGPFQGAVDIVVVQQDDGSFRSSPWYVRWFDPQGGDRRERDVDIWVNDVKASFSMSLNSKGEAFFEKEEDTCPQPHSSTAPPQENKKMLQDSLEILELGESSLVHDNEENLTFGRRLLLKDTQRMPVLEGELIKPPDGHLRGEAVEIVDENSNFIVEEAELVSTIESPHIFKGDEVLHTVISEDWFALPKIHTQGLEGDFLVMYDTTVDEILENDCKIVTDEDENNRTMINGRYLAPLVPISDHLVGGNSFLETSECTLEHVKHPRTSSLRSEKDAILKVEEVIPAKGSRDTIIPATSNVPHSRWWPFSLRKSTAGKISSLTSVISRKGSSMATQVTVGNPLRKEALKNGIDHQSSRKRIVQSYLPTPDQIASLKLKEGPNKITFTFPSALRKAQVDANIYLWKWNTRIVVSDVDGTITKSDVLGQFMPLVGKDWSHSGVTRLFSAIKENGYELLFLSARAISQSYLTRQFLGNLKQDGATLPEGPVFISPDGLLPSLYREVIRRTPHEFKISCLQEVRKLFPRDVNPFYAGFGNRSTDEISYRRVGIPRGKIFMINPKGEVMVSNHVHVKTYTSIHALVDGMFPPVCSSEQEDFNSWNFWKLPIPNLIDEISEKSSKLKKGRNSRK